MDATANDRGRRAPVLTGRLVLRRHGPEDFAASAALWADPDVVRHVTGTPSSRAESWARLLRHAGHWALFGHGYWTVRDRASDAFLGEVGLADWKREIEPSIEGEPEAGWVFRTDAQGRGLAREAVRAMLAWADARLDAPSTVCIVAPAQTASIRLARAVGYAEVLETRYRDEPTLLFRRPCSGAPAGRG